MGPYPLSRHEVAPPRKCQSNHPAPSNPEHVRASTEPRVDDSAHHRNQNAVRSLSLPHSERTGAGMAPAGREGNLTPLSCTVVILGAVPVNTAIAADFGNISPIRLPAGGKSLGARLWQEYSPFTSDIRFVLSSAEEKVVRDGGAFGLPTDVEIACADETSTLAGSILAAFTNTPCRSNSIIINFGDTFIPRQLTGNDRVVVARANSLVRWTTLGQSKSGSWSIIEKNRLKPMNLTHWIVAGVFELSEAEAFLKILRQSTREPKGCLDPFFVALLRYLERNGPINAKIVFEDRTKSWLDFGHIDSLHTSRLALGGASRSFNDIKVNPSKGVMTKRSSRSHDFSDERDWYFSLPESLKHIAPRVLSSRTDEYVKLEYYGYPSLQDLYLHSSLDLGDWEQVLHKLGETLAEFRAVVRQPEIDTFATVAARSDMYLRKTSQRMQDAFKVPGLSRAWKVSKINGAVCPTGNEILERLEDDLTSAGLLNPQRFGVVHGDFCLSNILYDRKSGVLRTVDPRGRFGNIALYGDPLYDEAKLGHSFHGHYDFLVYELMHLSLSRDSAELRVPVSALQQNIRELFARWNQDRLAGSATAVKLIEALLFLSMVPLHADRPNAQTAFVLRGRELYAQTVGPGK